MQKHILKCIDTKKEMQLEETALRNW